MATINCLRCGVSNRAGSNYCNNCGAELPSAGRASAPDDVEAQNRVPEADQPESPPSAEPPFQQPWLLDQEAATEAAADDSTPHDASDDWSRTERLITGVQGLLEPNAVAAPLASSTAEQPSDDAPLGSSRISHVDDAELRQLRRWLTTTPAQIQRPSSEQQPARRDGLYRPVLFLLLGLGLALPVLLQLARPPGSAHLWPGVTESFALIRALPDEAQVLTYWAYDPATAGEMDFVAHPVLTHLVGKRSQLIVASPLPGGPPLLLNLLEQVVTETRISYLEPLPIMIGYLPGGATVLPLLGQELSRVLPAAVPDTESAQLGPIDLALVVTARAEDAQAWLEQVQPRNGLPVLVVSSAGAEPVLRPYWESGQIAGLISGFDGASTYWSLLSSIDGSNANVNETAGEAINAAVNESVVVPYIPLLRVRRWMVFHNWGNVIFILIILFGNIAGFMRGRRGDGTMPATHGTDGERLTHPTSEASAEEAKRG